MARMSFSKEMYPKVALIKAAYNFTDVAYVHLDADDQYYFVSLEPKAGAQDVSEQTFVNEMLTQCVRHEVYQQTKNIRELLLARAMATSVIANEGMLEDAEEGTCAEDVGAEAQDDLFDESDILTDWFARNEVN